LLAAHAPALIRAGRDHHRRDNDKDPGVGRAARPRPTTTRLLERARQPVRSQLQVRVPPRLSERRKKEETQRAMTSAPVLRRGSAQGLPGRVEWRANRGSTLGGGERGGGRGAWLRATVGGGARTLAAKRASHGIANGQNPPRPRGRLPKLGKKSCGRKRFWRRHSVGFDAFDLRP